jgi:hypothetical protein
MPAVRARRTPPSHHSTSTLAQTPHQPACTLSMVDHGWTPLPQRVDTKVDTSESPQHINTSTDTSSASMDTMTVHGGSWMDPLPQHIDAIHIPHDTRCRPLGVYHYGGHPSTLTRSMHERGDREMRGQGNERAREEAQREEVSTWGIPPTCETPAVTHYPSGTPSITPYPVVPSGIGVRVFGGYGYGSVLGYPGVYSC